MNVLWLWSLNLSVSASLWYNLGQDKVSCYLAQSQIALEQGVNELCR